MKFTLDELVGWLLVILFGVPVFSMALVVVWKMFFSMIESLF